MSGRTPAFGLPTWRNGGSLHFGVLWGGLLTPLTPQVFTVDSLKSEEGLDALSQPPPFAEEAPVQLGDCGADPGVGSGLRPRLPPAARRAESTGENPGLDVGLGSRPACLRDPGRSRVLGPKQHCHFSSQGQLNINLVTNREVVWGEMKRMML